MGGKKKYRHKARPGKGFGFFEEQIEDLPTPTFPQVKHIEAVTVPESTYESPLTPTPWLEPFAFNIAKKAADELIYGDRLKNHLKKNQKTVEYPKATPRQGDSRTGWWNTNYRKLSLLPISPDASTVNVYNNGVSTETLPQNTDVHFTFSSLDLLFEGKFTRERVRQEIIPKVVEALVEAGLSHADAENRVATSLGEILNQRVTIDKIIASVNRILSNIDYEIKTGVVAAVHQEPAAASLSSAATPTSLDTQIVNEPKPISNTKIKTTKWKKNLQERMRIEQMEQRENSWVDLEPSQAEQEFRADQKRQNALIDQNIRANSPIKTVDITTTIDTNAQEIEKEKDTSWQEEFLAWQESQVESNEPQIAQIVDVLPSTEVSIETENSLIGRTAPQLDRLIDTTRNIREQKGLSHKEALSQLSDFNEVRTKVRQLRNQIRAIEKNGDGEEGKEKIQSLRDQLAVSLNAFRKITHTKEVEADAKPVTVESATSADETNAPLVEEGVKEKSDAEKAEQVEKIKVLQKKFDVISKKYSIGYVGGEGTKWYSEHISKELDFEKIFSYVQYHASDAVDSKFRDGIHFVVETQLAFQVEAALLAYFLAGPVDSVKELEEKVETLQKIGRQITSMQKRYNSSLYSEQEEAKKVFQELSMAAEIFVPPEVEKTEVNDESFKLTTFAERLEARNKWKEEKKNYENEYAVYLEQEKLKKEQQTWKGKLGDKLAFWRKESQPDSLVLAQQKYQYARRKYAETLGDALTLRSEKNSLWGSTGNREGLTAGLANRFVLRSAHDKLGLEKQFVPGGVPSRTLEGIKEVLKKHKNKIKYTSYLVTIGTGLLTGGLNTALHTLVGKAVSAKVSMVGGIVGASAGAFVGHNVATGRRWMRDRSMKNAQTSFSVERIEALESAYEKNYRAHENALKNQARYAVGGAILGGLTGSVLAGSVEHALAASVHIPNIGAPTTPEISPLDMTHTQPIPVPDSLATVPSAQAPHISVTESAPAKTGLENVIPTEPTQKIVIKGVPDVAETVSPKVNLETRPSAEQFPPHPVTPGLDELLKNDAPSTDEQFPYHGPTPEQEELMNSKTVTTEISEPQVELGGLSYTFEPGNKINTVSEALYETWKNNHSLLQENLTNNEFLAKMYSAVAEMEQEPDLYGDVLEQMGVSSGDLDEVLTNQKINLQPFFEYLNEQ